MCSLLLSIIREIMEEFFGSLALKAFQIIEKVFEFLSKRYSSRKEFSPIPFRWIKSSLEKLRFSLIRSTTGSSLVYIKFSFREHVIPQPSFVFNAHLYINKEVKFVLFCRHC